MTRMPIIVDPTSVLQIHPGVKRKSDIGNIDTEFEYKVLIPAY